MPVATERLITRLPVLLLAALALPAATDQEGSVVVQDGLPTKAAGAATFNTYNNTNKIAGAILNSKVGAGRSVTFEGSISLESRANGGRILK